MLLLSGVNLIHLITCLWYTSKPLMPIFVVCVSWGNKEIKMNSNIFPLVAAWFVASSFNYLNKLLKTLQTNMQASVRVMDIFLRLMWTVLLSSSHHRQRSIVVLIKGWNHFISVCVTTSCFSLNSCSQPPDVTFL